MTGQDEISTSFLYKLPTPIKVSQRFANDEDEAMILDSPVMLHRNGATGYRAVTPQQVHGDNDSDSGFFSEISPSICTKASRRKMDLCLRLRQPSPAERAPESSRDTVMALSQHELDATPVCNIRTEFDHIPRQTVLEELEVLTRDPNSSARVQSLKFNFIVMKSATSREDMGELVELSSNNGSLIVEINEQYHIEATIDDGPFPIDLGLMRRVLGRLANLKVLHLTWTDTTCCGQAFDPATTADILRNEVPQVQQAVLGTLSSHDIRLSTLILEPFMFSEIALPSSLDPQCMNVFGSITTLGLDIVYTKKPFQQDTLEYFLSLLPKLRHLRIRAIPADWAPQDITFLPETHFEHLESLDLRCLHFRLDSFAVFLRKHSKTVKHLSLVSLDGLSPPDSPCEVFWDLIFLLIKAECDSLESAVIDGVFRQEGLGSQVFYKHDGDVPHRFREQWAMKGDVMEKFLVEGGQYPLPKWRSLVN